MSFEEEYQDVLHNIESAIVMYYREHPDLIDAEVEAGLEWLSKYYSAQAQGKTSSYRKPKGNSAQVAEAVKVVCDWRLEREKLSATDEKGNRVELDIDSKTPSEIVACLKRIKSSIKLWTKKGGRQGYLNFVKQYIPSEATLVKKEKKNPLGALLGLFKIQ
jgi:hypothetical protein